jgi:uncharacterized protein (DUF1499 family)
VVAIYVQKTVHEGLWARRIALFFLQLLALTAVLHRFGFIATPAAINLMAVSLGGLVLAILIAVVALTRIWFGGQQGAGWAFAAIAIAIVGLAAPAYFLSQTLLLPRLNDIETTPSEPIAFKQLAAMRPADSNRIETPDAAKASAQLGAYPDIKPMALERSATETFDMVHEAVKRLGWTVVMAEPPSGGAPGHIEATDKTLVMGFINDVAVEISGDDTHAVINIRSASRYGSHDLGGNAKRIRAFFDEMKATLEKGEKTSLEQAEPKPKAGTAPQLNKPVKKRRARRSRRSIEQPAPPPQSQQRQRRLLPWLNPY